MRHAPAGSAIARAMHPEVAAWANGEVNAQLLALIGDMLAEGNWQRAGRKNAPHPKPIDRPGAENGSRSFGKDPIPISQFDDWWESN
ncbi:hypothetical protein CIK84_11260 [Glutamicibacter arilaitensis]|uniref:Uncharacterized protein n=1 Tax=Glutamicibacter arilaitensis TaxID=256701 RepID=A0A2N7RZH3_9MICC|nr:hypothetical protein CIK84_11260 [Glutamicibacter arilaitensis]